MRDKISNIVYIICVYLLLSSIPFSLFIDNTIIAFCLQTTLKLGFIVFYFIITKKEKMRYKSLDKLNQKAFLFIPFFLICISNFIFVLVAKQAVLENISLIDIIFGLINSILVAICEELIFRNIICNELSKKYNKYKTILLSSLIFGAIHLVNISSLGSIPTVLAQCGYSFALGLLLSMMYLNSKNIILPMLLHFGFNFFNDAFITNIFELNWNLWFYLVNIGIYVIIFLYAVIIELTVFKGSEKNVTEDLDR